MEEQKPPVQKSDSNTNAALSYIWIISVIMIVTKKNDEFVMFHAKQGLILFIASFLYFIPYYIGTILDILIVICIIVGFIKAMAGERYKLPVIGDLAEKIKF
ncbi:MAG: hypothetical protein WCT08_04350 [Patescibacteria group bacterium]|jgi:uncharacterized membrane protein